MQSHQQELERGLAHHRAGNLVAAQRSYVAVLSKQPHQTDALNLLGACLVAQGQVDQGIVRLQQAIKLQPKFAHAHFNLGNAYREKQRPDLAIASYRQALNLQPNFVEACCNLGNVLYLTGDAASAESFFAHAIKLSPGYAEAHNNLGLVLQQLGKRAGAVAAFRRAIACNPLYEQAYANLGALCEAAGEFETAVRIYGEAVNRLPDSANLSFRLGNALESLRRPEEAITAFRRVIALRPRSEAAFNNLGNQFKALKRLPEATEAYQQALAINPTYTEALNNLGLVLMNSGRNDEAVTTFRAALQTKPDAIEALINLGVALHNRGEFAEAEVQLRQAVGLDPRNADAIGNLGLSLKCQNRIPEAIAAYEQALALNPRHVNALNNLGYAHLARNDLATARRHFEQALALGPENPKVILSLALTELVQGNLPAGWPGYEARWDSVQTAFRRPFTPPQWRGTEPLAGRRILLHAEQGLGDTLQFIRYVPLIAARGATVILEVQPVLRRLLADFPGAATVIAAGDPLPEFDCHCPLLSLPLALGTGLGTIPADTPYLAVPPAVSAPWSARLPASRGPRIGINWCGNPKHKNDFNRSIPFARFSTLFADLPAQFVNLQKEIRPAEVDSVRQTPGLFDASPLLQDFQDTAALVAGLDLVITVDTSIAHLAGALGKPTWILLPFSPDWRWLLARADSPWYPQARLFRQPETGDWDSVLTQVRRQLSDLVATAPVALPSAATPSADVCATVA